MFTMILPWRPWNTDISAKAAYNNNHYSMGSSSYNFAAQVHRTNIGWNEDSDDEIDDGGAFPNQPFRHNVDLSPLLPFGMMLIISTIIFMLIIFRRWPGLVAGIVAGCLTSISIYLLLLTLKEQKLVYE